MVWLFQREAERHPVQFYPLSKTHQNIESIIDGAKGKPLSQSLGEFDGFDQI